MALKFNPFTSNFDTVLDKASEIKYQRADIDRKNIDAASDLVEPALNDLDDAIGSLASSPTNYVPASADIVASHLTGIDSELGNILSLINNFDWQPSVVQTTITTPPPSPSLGDRYLVGLDTTAGIATGAWTGQDGNIAEFDGSVWQFIVPITGTFVSSVAEPNLLYLFGGTTWDAKYFEATTASGFLSKVGFDIRLENLVDGSLIVGVAGVATEIDTIAQGDIQAGSSGLTIKSEVISDNEISTGAAINAAKIADGSVDNTEFQALNGVSSNIQTQLDSKLETVTDTNSIDLTKTGVDLSADLKLSPANASANNIKIQNDTTGAGLRSQLQLGEGVEDDGAEALRVKLDETGPLSSFIFRSADGLKVNAVDEDDMSSDSDTLVPTQQSVKAYVDNEIGAVPKGAIKTDLHDPISTTLPGGASAVVDGETLVDGDKVLFTNLAVDNHRIYEVSGVGVSLIWTVVNAFDSQPDPAEGDLVVIAKGTGFAGQVGTFANAAFSFNEVLRLFDGANYQEISSIKKSTLVDNSITVVYSVSLGGSENQEISYSITRGLNKEVGKIILGASGSDSSLNRYTASVIGDVGIEFDTDINAGNVRLLADASNLGTDADISYYVTRWSDSTGGPAGIPNYATSGSGTPAAGTSVGQIQLRGNDGNLAADSDFVYDTASDELQIGDLAISKLSGSLSLNDNQTTPLSLFSFDDATHHAIVEYSIQRGTDRETGRLLIAHDDISAVSSTDSIATAATGVTFVATLNAGNVEVQYTSTSTGQTGNFKYSIRKWD